MNLLDAVKIVNTKYSTYQRTTDLVEIEVHKVLNENSFYYIALLKVGDGVILTDLAESAEVLCDVSKERWEELCKKHNVCFNDWHIETPFNSMKDLENFIALLDEVSENN